MGSDKKALTERIRQLVIEGDIQGIMKALKTDDSQCQDPLLFLQSTLQSSDDPEFCTVIDDAMWRLVKGKLSEDVIEKNGFRTIIIQCEQEYGAMIHDALPDLRELLIDLFSSERLRPPINAIVAAIGLHAQRELGVFKIDKDSVGKQAHFFTPNCKICGGEQKGKGYSICSSCFSRGRLDIAKKIVETHLKQIIQEKPLYERSRIDVDATIAMAQANVTKDMELELMPPDMVIAHIKQNKTQYGCTSCNYEPVKNCTCAITIDVPYNCKNGQIAMATRFSPNESFYTVLQIEN